MGENIRFIQLIDDLRKKGIISDYVQAAAQLGTNKAAISDIKSGRKKLSIELVKSMKKSYPEVSVDWIIMGDGEPFIKPSQNITSSSDTSVFIEKLAQQAEEIGQLKEQIRQLTKEKEILATNARSTHVANVG